jgi:hypothetical protein
MDNSSSNLDRAIFLVIFLRVFFTTERGGGEPGARGRSEWCFDEGVERSNVG